MKRMNDKRSNKLPRRRPFKRQFPKSLYLLQPLGVAIAGSLCVVTFLTNCSALQTTEATTTDPVRAHAVLGNYYYLPRGKVKVTGAKGSDNTFVVTISSVMEPDPQHRYFLSHHTNTLYDDDFKIEVNDKGLLATVNLTVEDKTPAIIGDIAGMVANVLKLAAGMDTNRSLGAEDGEPKPFSVVFDPFDPRDVQKANDVLSKANFILDEPTSATLTHPNTAFAKKDGLRSVDGVIFHPPVPVTISLHPTKYSTQITEGSLMLPDKHSILAFDLRRSPFIKRTSELTFTDGMLKSSHVIKPSQIAGVLGIPKAILTAIVPLPLELKQTQINALTADKNLIEARKALLAAQAPAPSPTPPQ